MVETVFVRLRLILIGLAILTGLVIFQLLRIDLGSANVVYFRDLSETITQYPREFAPERGQIYDRTGELLATNDVQYELALSPSYVVNDDDVIEVLSDVLDKSSTDLRLTLETAREKNQPYVLIARPVSSEIGNEIKALEKEGKKDLRGIELDPISH